MKPFEGIFPVMLTPHADGAIDPGRRDPASRAGAAGRRIGAGDIRVGAVVQVQQCALGALEQDVIFSSIQPLSFLAVSQR